jgi:hypothetical protein
MDDKAELLAILEDEFHRHPGAGPQDLRKLVYQSVFGGDHLLADPARFRADLQREWSDVPPSGLPASAIQPISPDGRVARIHLAPCKAARVVVEDLVDALLAQRRKGGERSPFELRWKAVVELADEGRLPIPTNALRDLRRLEGLPHHNEAYGQAAYRVINDLQDPAIAARLRAWGIASP